MQHISHDVLVQSLTVQFMCNYVEYNCLRQLYDRQLTYSMKSVDRVIVIYDRDTVTVLPLVKLQSSNQQPLCKLKVYIVVMLHATKENG